MSVPQFEWHQGPWRLARSALERGAHAILLVGAKGLGKRWLALRIAANRLCASPQADGEACGQCASCHWLEAGTHPDFALIEPMADEDSAESSGGKRARPISIDQIRELSTRVSLSGHAQEGKVFVICPAESMNTSAANALLKNLEEPTGRTLYILVSHRPSLLPPTIRSRCFVLTIAMTRKAQALSWLARQGVDDAELQLALAGGAPLEAQSIASDTHWSRRSDFLSSFAQGMDDPIALAERYRDVPGSTLLGWLTRWTYDLMQMRFGGNVRYHQDLVQRLQPIAAAMDPIAASRLYRRLVRQQRWVNHPLNPRLFSEQLLVDCCRVFSGSQRQAV
jgi:DNA polymerase-3 subunit delta'